MRLSRLKGGREKNSKNLDEKLNEKQTQQKKKWYETQGTMNSVESCRKNDETESLIS